MICGNCGTRCRNHIEATTPTKLGIKQVTTEIYPYELVQLWVINQLKNVDLLEFIVDLANDAEFDTSVNVEDRYFLIDDGSTAAAVCILNGKIYATAVGGSSTESKANYSYIRLVGTSGPCKDKVYEGVNLPMSTLAKFLEYGQVI